MPTLIDGHNLIPHLGLRLDDPEDELALARRLGEYCRIARKTGIEIYFDNARPGSPASQSFGMVKAHFVLPPRIADEAIRQRLKKLGKAARNWTVVSSDRQVQAEARALGATVFPSEQYASMVMETMRVGLPESSSEAGVSKSEVDYWLDQFNNHKQR